MARAAIGWLLAVAAGACASSACASSAPQVRDGASLAQLEVERVARILEQRHPSHARVDEAIAKRLARAGDDARTRELDALAATYDPFCHYLDAAALARRRSQAYGSGPALARGRIVERDGARVALIELPSFYLSTERSASGDVAFIARELQARGASVLVLDLRGNGGGVVAEALALAGALLGGGALAYQRDAAGVVSVLRGGERASPWAGPLVLLLDRGTASMAELFAAALQDRGRALLIGERSYGKGLAQTLVLLSSPLGPAQGAVEVSERAFYRLDGRALQGAGVTPDVELAADSAAPPRVPPFSAPWLPAKIEPPSASAAGASPLDPARIERARAASASVPAPDSELDRVLAAAIAYAR
jgi:hypothetical protein